MDFGYMLSEPKVSKIATLLAVECNAYSYWPDTETTELHKGTYTLDGLTTLHVTYSQSVAEKVSASGAIVKNAVYYATAADITLEGSGSIELSITGRKLTAAAAVVRAEVLNADENSTVETLDNALITSRDEAAQTAAWVRNYLLNRSTYEFSTRGNPELDPLDNIAMESQFNHTESERVPAMVLVNETTYTGGIQSKITAKRMVSE